MVVKGYKFSIFRQKHDSAENMPKIGTQDARKSIIYRILRKEYLYQLNINSSFTEDAILKMLF